MPLEIQADVGTERIQEEIERAVRSALGLRGDAGDWLLIVHRRNGGYLVDLTNRDGIMRQWFFQSGDPVESAIKEALNGAA